MPTQQRESGTKGADLLCARLTLGLFPALYFPAGVLFCALVPLENEIEQRMYLDVTLL